MKKNLSQFEKGFSLTDFMKRYGTETQCAISSTLALWLSNPDCGGRRYSSPVPAIYINTRLAITKSRWSAGHCSNKPKLSMNVWFLAIYLLTQAKTDLSALVMLMRQSVFPAIPLGVLSTRLCKRWKSGMIANLWLAQSNWMTSIEVENAGAARKTIRIF